MRQIREKLRRACNRLELLLHATLTLGQDVVDPAVRLGKSDLGRDGVPRNAMRNAGKAARDIAWPSGMTEAGQGLGIDGAEDNLRVDQHPVAVEDDKRWRAAQLPHR